MIRIIIDATLPEKLQHLTEVAEFCDESGRVLGRFLPILDLSQYEPLEPQISQEEIQRRKQNKGKTYPTAEVLDHLENVR